MKIDREYYDSYEWDGKKLYRIEKIADGIKAYSDGNYFEKWFEEETGEEIGYIQQADNRTNFKTYYHASCTYGWDGKKATKKQFITRLCTKAEYSVARALMIEEYKSRK